MVAASSLRGIHWKAWLARLRKLVLGMLLALLGIILVAFLMMALPRPRSWLLHQGITMGAGALPGSFTAGAADWPEPTRLIVRDVLWLNDDVGAGAPGDTLAAVPVLDLQLNWQGIRQGIIAVKALHLDAEVVDVPAIVAGFEGVAQADTAADQLAAQSAPKPLPFFQFSSWPPLPAIMADSLVLAVERIVVAPGVALSKAQVVAAADLGPELPVSLRVEKSRLNLVLAGQSAPVLMVQDMGLGASLDPFADIIELDNFSVLIVQAGADTLAQQWRQWGGVHLGIEGKAFGVLGGEPKFDFSGGFDIPSPADLALLSDLLPEQVDLLPQEKGSGQFTVSTGPGSVSQPIGSANVTLDLSESSWIDKGYLAGRFDQGQVQVDSLALALLGTEVLLQGKADTLQVDASFELIVHEPTLARMLAPSDLEVSRSEVRLAAAAHGKWRDPDVQLDLEAAIQTSVVEIPNLNLEASVSKEDGCWLALNMARGMQTTGVVLDSVLVNWHGPRDLFHSSDQDFNQEFQIEVFGLDGAIKLAGAALADSVSKVRLDTLRVMAVEQSIAIADPVHLEINARERLIKLDNLAFSGNAGYVQAAGSWSPENFDISSQVDLLLAEELLQVLAPNQIWSQDGGLDISVVGAVDLTGTEDGPEFGGGLKVSLLPHRERLNVEAQTEFGLTPGEENNLQASFLLQTSQQEIFSGNVLWPGSFNPETNSWVPSPDRGVEVDIPVQGFGLEIFNTLLPAETDLNGNLELAFRVGGDGMEKSSLAGHFQSDPLVINLPNSSRINLGIACETTGTLLDPRISGQIEVKSGFIRIPEIPANLLPVEGESLLLDVGVDTLFVSPWSADQGVAAHAGPVLNNSGSTFLPDLDVNILLPGDLIIHGYGLSVELQGDLNLSRGIDPDGLPALSMDGVVEVHTGSLNFMNRVFTFNRGEIQFQGSAPPNPQLAISLESEVGDYLVRIEVHGEADDPVIELIAEPELSQADVMALLLFGQPATDLDTSQRGRMSEEENPGKQLQQNLAALAVVFGTSGMQNTMSSTLGVDMVELGSGSEGDSTLIVGKFITPRILVKYNQSLEKSGTYFMTLEYSITKFLDFVSTYGQGEEDSGLELKWSQRN